MSSDEVARLPNTFDLPLSDQKLGELVERAKDWALMHGIGMRPKQSHDSLQIAPFVLFPTPFPRDEFHKAIRLQPILNELMHSVAHDFDFLRDSLEQTIQVDPFTAHLYRIHETVHREGRLQPVSLALLRSDLMLETVCCPAPIVKPYCCWKQVEINTIASGFGWLGPSSMALHRYTSPPAPFWATQYPSFAPDPLLYAFINLFESGVMKPFSLGLLRSDYMTHSTKNHIKQVELNTIASSFGALACRLVELNRYVLEEFGCTNQHMKNMPDNTALEGLCGGMARAWQIYGDAHASILFVVEDVTYNICDQRFHEFCVRKLEPRAPVLRRTLTQIATTGYLSPNNELLIDGLPIAVIYFRAGYEPAHYPSQNEWDARLLLERSTAIKCPSIHYHLAGTKKVQQALARPGILERFLTEPAKVEAVNQIFTGLYGLDMDEAGDQAVQMALDDPERYVLKPQREGGGNNTYGLAVREAVQRMRTTNERCAWILMERIRPPLSKGYVVRPGQIGLPPLVDLVSELGIFGVVIGDNEKIVYNEQVGHMLRTKLATADEGGVAAGLGALDSPFLVDL